MISLKRIILIAAFSSLVLSQSQGDDQKQSGDPQQYIQYSCILLSRYQLSNYGSRLLSIVKSQTDSKDYETVWKKIYVGHVQKCLETFTYEQAMRFLQEIKSNTFDQQQYVELFQGFDMAQFEQNDWIRDIDENEDAIWHDITDFESLMSEKKQKEDKKKAEQDDLDYLRNLQPPPLRDYEPKVFGFSTRSSSKFSDILLLLGVFGGFGALLYVGYTKVLADEEVNKKKSKKKTQQKIQ